MPMESANHTLDREYLGAVLGRDIHHFGSAANIDLANSESSKLARSMNALGRRTIGVLTKLDFMGAGTNANDILTRWTYPPRLGFTAMLRIGASKLLSKTLCINAEKPTIAALDGEKGLFATHSAYRDTSHERSTKYLTRTLNQGSPTLQTRGSINSRFEVLMNRIRDRYKARKNALTHSWGRSNKSPTPSAMKHSSETKTNKERLPSGL